MKLALLNDDEVNQLQVYLDKIADRSYLSVVMQSAHNPFAEFLAELYLSFSPGFPNQS